MTKEELRKEVDASGLSRSEVSACLKINPRTLRRWLSGQTQVPGWLDEVWRARFPSRDVADKPEEVTR